MFRCTHVLVRRDFQKINIPAILNQIQAAAVNSSTHSGHVLRFPDLGIADFCSQDTQSAQPSYTTRHGHMQEFTFTAGIFVVIQKNRDML